MAVKKNRIVPIGLVFGRLTLIKDLGMIDKGKANKLHMGLAKCECGNVKEYQISSLKRGNTRSCGCLCEELKSQRSKTHGMTKHPLYSVWISMRNRCYYRKDISYNIYGKRGIRVCKKWITNFSAFMEWALSNGWRKGLQIDRFPNKNGNYSPSNCRIATSKQNNNNRRNTPMVNFNGQVKSISEWSELYNIPYHRLFNRIKVGKWPIGVALTLKPNKHNRINQ